MYPSAVTETDRSILMLLKVSDSWLSGLAYECDIMYQRVPIVNCGYETADVSREDLSQVDVDIGSPGAGEIIGSIWRFHRTSG